MREVYFGDQGIVVKCLEFRVQCDGCGDVPQNTTDFPKREDAVVCPPGGPVQRADFTLRSDTTGWLRVVGEEDAPSLDICPACAKAKGLIK